MLSENLTGGAPKFPSLAGRCRQRAFTMVELIVVIVLLGTLAGMAAPRFFDNDSFSHLRYRDEVATALRYAQRVAVATGCSVQVEISASTYILEQQPAAGGHCDASSPDFNVPVLLPTGEVMQGNAPSGTLLSPAQTIRFLPSGRTDLAGDIALDIGDRSVTVYAASGLVTTS